MLPFTAEVFFRLFEHYNAAIWPAQIVAYALGALALLLTVRPRRGGDRAIAAVLAAFWLWTGVVYHMMFFAAINWAAPAFGAVFVIQGLLFAWTGALRGRLDFRFGPGARGWIGVGLLVLSMVVYPLIGAAAGHGWPRAPMFGVAPCPTTIFTLGMLLLSAPRAPLYLSIVPILWSIVGGTAAWLLDVPEDLALPLAGGLSLWLILRRRRDPALRSGG